MTLAIDSDQWKHWKAMETLDKVCKKLKSAQKDKKLCKKLWNYTKCWKSDLKVEIRSVQESWKKCAVIAKVFSKMSKKIRRWGEGG